MSKRMAALKEIFGPRALWRSTILELGVGLDISGPIADGYLGRGDWLSDGTRILLEKGVTNYFIKDGVHMECVSRCDNGTGDEPETISTTIAT